MFEENGVVEDNVVKSIDKDRLHRSVGCFDGAWRVDGIHPELGGGVLGYHRLKSQADHNAELIYEAGGEAVVVTNDYLTSYGEDGEVSGWLLVDDWRDLVANAVARDYEEAIELLDAFNFEGLMIDYDLGRSSPGGVAVLEWAIENNRLPKYVEVVSSHPFGSQRLVETLKDAGYFFDRDTVSEMTFGGDVHSFQGFWRRLEEGEKKPRRKVVVYLNK